MQELGPACLISIHTHSPDAQGHREHARMYAHGLTQLSQQYALVQISKVVQLPLFRNYLNSIYGYVGMLDIAKIRTLSLCENLTT